MLHEQHTHAGIRACLIATALVLAATSSTFAHPGSGIAVDSQGNVYFVDTGQGVWKINAKGELVLIHTRAYHWMALDVKGHFAASRALGDVDGTSFERATPNGSTPTLLISSDFPIAVGRDGGLYYVPFNRTTKRELVRRMPDGRRSAIATLPIDTSPEPMMWINGITPGPDGSFYITDNDAVRKVDAAGSVSTVHANLALSDCTDTLPDAPKLPYLRGLAVARDGTIYAAANGCRTVISIPPKGAIRTLFKSERPWSPTGVALFGDDVYVLEYLHTPGDDRRAWIPRVRKMTRDGKANIVATVKRR